MTRMPTKHVGATRPNLLAILIICSAIGILVLNFQLQPARAVSRRANRLPAITQLAPRPALPLSGDKENQQSRDDSATGDNAAAAQSSVRPVCQGRLALLMNLTLLEEGIRRLKKHPGYTATFHKDEYLPDAEEVTGIQTIEFKARHEPFSVYMKWLSGDEGRELIYVDGQNGNKMVVHAGQGLKSIITLNLSPEGSTAMGQSRHPVTQSGLLNLAKTMVTYRKRDLASEGKVHCCMSQDQLFDNRPCYCFTIEFGSEEIDPDYRKTVVLFDKQWSLPVWVKNYEWPAEAEDGDEQAQSTPEELDEETFVEFYAFSNIRFDRKPRDCDFAKANEEYNF